MSGWRRGAMLLAATACLVAPGASQAAMQISLGIASLAQLTGLSDVTFTNIDPNAAAVNSQNDCVWTNSVTRSYTVTATGSGAGGTAFTIANSGGKIAPYRVGWAGSANAGSGTNLTANVASPVFTSSAIAPACTPGPANSSTLTITIVASDLQTMIASSAYTGSLTLVITPQ